MLNKAKYTSFIMDLAIRFPCLFPKRIAFFSNEYNSNSSYILDKKNKEPEIKTVSLLEGASHWRSISYSVLLDKSELDRLNIWRGKRSIHPRFENGLTITSRNFDRDRGWINVGYIRVNKDTFMDDLSSIYTIDDFFNGIYITLTKYSSGLSFLTFYIGVNDQATKLIKDVEVGKMDYFVELNSFNVFSKKNNGMTLLDYYNHSLDILRNNIRLVNDSALKMVQYLLNEMKISKNADDLFCTFDMFVNGEPPYSNVVYKSEDDRATILFKKCDKFKNLEFSTNNDEEFYSADSGGLKGVDLIYLRSCMVQTEEQFNEFRHRPRENVKSHLSILPAYMIAKKIDGISSKINMANLHDKRNSMSKLHNKLFSISYDLNIMKSWLKSLAGEIKYNLPSGYHDNASKVIASQLRRVEDLKEITGSVYSLSENRIQISNVKYNQFYSAIVFVLVLLQIVLAAMTIDWSKKNVWYEKGVAWIGHLWAYLIG